MNALRLIPVLLSALLMAAHCMWHGLVPLALACLLFPALLFVRRPWVASVTRGVLWLWAAEWARTVAFGLHSRMAAGRPWALFATILLTVALITLLSSLVFRAPAIRRRYGIGA